MSAPEVRSFGRELRLAMAAELSKLCSLPTTWMVLGSTFIVNLLLAFAFSNAALQGIVSIDSALDIGLASVSYAQAGFMVFGILIACSEYGGQIRTTLMAMPRRGTQLAAAMLVLTFALIPAAILVSASGLLVTQIFYDGTASPIARDELATSLAGVTAYLTLTTLLSAAIAMVLRRMLPAVALVLGYYFVAGPLIRDSVGWARYLPDTAGVVLW
ncbi:ABC transporter permease, partial [Paenibacillus sp. 598K]|uniref:ABC transporter permease n=1 Tax=Paenibacillus sp. 598K TaxID=1117987 RepID=UPI00162970D7